MTSQVGAATAKPGTSLNGRWPAGPVGTATVFVSHTPWQAEVAAKSAVGLMLSSHTHEGQIWPFGYLVRFTHPFLSGKHELNGMPIIVCRGGRALGNLACACGSEGRSCASLYDLPSLARIGNPSDQFFSGGLRCAEKKRAPGDECCASSAKRGNT